MSLQGNLPFYECPHTCRIDITSMYINKHNLFILIYILRRRNLHTHLTEPRVSYHCVSRTSVFFNIDEIKIFIIIILNELIAGTIDAYMCQESNLAFVMIMRVVWSALNHFLNKCRFNVNLTYFDIRICVGLWSVCCRFVIGLSSALLVCCRLQFQQCANDPFSIGVMSVIYRSQIGRFHTESYPKWPRHETYCFYGVFSNIVGGRQLADSLKVLQSLSVSCRFGRCDWDIRVTISSILCVGEVSGTHMNHAGVFL